MSYHVHIEDDFMNQIYRVFLYEKRGDERVIHRGDGVMHVVADPSRGLSEEDKGLPFAQLPHDAAHAVLAALSRQLGAVEHPEQLRRDYDAERARVDRFIAHLTPQGRASERG